MVPSNPWTICVALIFATISSVYSQFRYDYTYNPKVGGWIKMHAMPATFFDAFRICNAEGAVLASPLNVAFKSVMVSLHKRTDNSCPLYTGIHSSVAKGAFATVEGKVISKIAIEWAPYEPDNYNDTESCIVMLGNGTMADVSCSETYPFICYRKKTANMALNECGTIDNEYFLEPRTGSCYKFHRIGRTWRNAYMTCMAEGGYLAIINSLTEVQVIKELVAKYPHDLIFSPSKDVFSIGFHDWGENGVWYTVHGQPLHEAGYSNFSEGQPDNDKTYDSTGSHCGGIFRNGLLDDLWCIGHNVPFICEKRPDSLITEDEDL